MINDFAPLLNFNLSSEKLFLALKKVFQSESPSLLSFTSFCRGLVAPDFDPYLRLYERSYYQQIETAAPTYNNVCHTIEAKAISKALHTF